MLTLKIVYYFENGMHPCFYHFIGLSYLTNVCFTRFDTKK
jgi:hypothetical protein